MNLAPELLAEYLGFAQELAEAAGQITLKYFHTALHVDRKADASPVTVADRETEKFIREQIAARYPEHGLVGEEFGKSNAGAPLCWVIDPIDGTKAFIDGVPLYTVLLGLVTEGDSVAGVIHCPPLRETAAAATGLGCTLNGKPCRVSQCKELGQARIHTTDFSALMQKRPGMCNELLMKTNFCRTWADAYGYLLVASGRADVMIDPEMNLWDIAALKPVITEAGGKFSDLDGKETIHSAHSVATNGLLHPAVLAISQG